MYLPIPFLDVINADTCLVCPPWYPSLLHLETLFYSPQWPWFWYRLYRCITPWSVTLSNWRQCLFAPKPPSRCLFRKAAWTTLRLMEGCVSQHSDSFPFQNPCAILPLLGPMRKRCSAVFVCLVIGSSLPSRSDVSYSRNLIGMHGTYNRWGPHFLWQNTWSHPTRICEERHWSIHRMFTLVLTLNLQKYNDTDSVSTQGIEGRVCAHACGISGCAMECASRMINPKCPLPSKKL